MGRKSCEDGSREWFMLPQAKECWKLSEAGKGKQGFSPSVFKSDVAQPTPRFQTSGLCNGKRIKF